MRQPFRNLIVVGQGAAGLAAALAAAEMVRVRSWPIAVTLVDKAAENEAGGNTRWSPSYMRMASPTHMEATFVADMREATKRQGDEAYFAHLAAEAPATVKWIASNGIEFIQPTYYLARPMRRWPQLSHCRKDRVDLRLAAGVQDLNFFPVSLAAACTSLNWARYVTHDIVLCFQFYVGGACTISRTKGRLAR